MAVSVLSFQGCGSSSRETWLTFSDFSCGPRLFTQSGTGRPRRVCVCVGVCVCMCVRTRERERRWQAVTGYPKAIFQRYCFFLKFFRFSGSAIPCVFIQFKLQVNSCGCLDL